VKARELAAVIKVEQIVEIKPADQVREWDRTWIVQKRMLLRKELNPHKSVHEAPGVAIVAAEANNNRFFVNKKRSVIRRTFFIDAISRLFFICCYHIFRL
jgi:hypothetical protein